MGDTMRYGGRLCVIEVSDQFQCSEQVSLSLLYPVFVDTCKCLAWE